MVTVPALWQKHLHLADTLANDWHIPGADQDDVRQEARIALWEAAKAFDLELNVPFTAFARLVIGRRLRDCLRNAQAGKHAILTNAVRDHDHPTSQTEILERRADLRALVQGFQQLSLLEQQAVTASANRTPYTTVGPFRSVDNAVQRGRRKLRQALT
jgi:RNA polymerase sigma factor (sigma-70 family)